MKSSKLILLIFLIPLMLVNGWGNKGHKLITKHALTFLPNEIKLSDEIKKAIVDHSVDPDNRKKQDPTESQKHFIDIDYYKEFLDGKMIRSKDSLAAIYGLEEVTKQGILPWAIMDTYTKLTGAFKSGDKDKIILYASDLAHYTGDAHQPLHATINYNGQLTNQKGIHFRYEIEMIDRYIADLESNLILSKPVYIKNLSDFIFDGITEANFYMDLILSSDKFSYDRSGKEFNDDYYRLLWFRTKYITEIEINEGAAALASLIYSAWIDAGKPDLNL